MAAWASIGAGFTAANIHTRGKKRLSFKYTSDRKQKVYYPDICVYSDKQDTRPLVIEVKSVYTAGITNEAYFNAMMKKAQSVRDARLTFLLMIFDSKGLLLLHSDCNPKSLLTST